MSVKVIDTLKPKNDGAFPIAEAADIAVTAEKRLPEALADKADASALAETNAAVQGKANASDVATTTANLQGQINQIEISATAEAVVAPEVAAARVSADGAEYTTLKMRLDTNDLNTSSNIDYINSEIGDISKPLTLKSMDHSYLTGDVGEAIERHSRNTFTSAYANVTSGQSYRVTYVGKQTWTNTVIWATDDNDSIVAKLGTPFDDATDGVEHSVTVSVPTGATRLYVETYIDSTEILSVNSIETTIADRLGDLEKNKPIFYPSFNIELGSINLHGHDTESETRCRSNNISIINEFNGIYFVADEGYKIGLRFYDNGGAFISDYTSPFVRQHSISTLDIPNAATVRFIMAYDDDSTIEDVEAMYSHLSVYFSTADISLTEQGAAAEASITGKKIDDINNRLHKSIKILGIGNSYTRDSVRWLWKILDEAGYDEIIVGHGYWGASTLSQQYESLDVSSENHSIYQYRKYTSIDYVSTDNVALDDIFTDEAWDVVIFQQQSDEAGQYTSFVSNDFDITDFVNYVKNAINNNNLKIGIAATWSHAEGYTGEKFIEYYDGDPDVQLAAINSTIPRVADHIGVCDYIINVGEAVRLGRNNTYLNAIGDEMLRADKNHLDYGIPEYMAGIVYAISICGINPSEVLWFPTSEDDSHIDTASATLARIARQCAINAANMIC